MNIYKDSFHLVHIKHIALFNCKTLRTYNRKHSNEIGKIVFYMFSQGLSFYILLKFTLRYFS